MDDEVSDSFALELFGEERGKNRQSAPTPKPVPYNKRAEDIIKALEAKRAQVN